MDHQQQYLPEVLRLPDVQKIVPYSQNHIRRLEAQGKFPKRIRIGENRVAWVRSEVEDWLETRKAARSGEAG